MVLGFNPGGGSGDEEGFTGTQPPIRSDEEIDPDECNYIHNIAACDGQPPLPTYEDWVNDQENEVSYWSSPILSYGMADGKVVINIYLVVDPEVSNAIHNVYACTIEESEHLGIATVGGPGPSRENRPVAESDPLFSDGEPQPDVQLDDEDARDCESAGGFVYPDADGQMGCVVLNDSEAGDMGDIQQQPPVVTPQVLPATKSVYATIPSRPGYSAIPDFSGSGDYSRSGDTVKQGYGRLYRLVYPSLSLLRPLLEERVSQRQC